MERQGDQPLLRAVVQVTLDSPPRFVSRLDDSGAGRDELRLRLRARDRGADQVGERRQPGLDLLTRHRGREHSARVPAPEERQRLAPLPEPDPDHPPDVAVHDDRRADRRREPGRAHGLRDDPALLPDVLDPDRRAGLAHGRREARFLHRPTAADLEHRVVVRGHDLERVARARSGRRRRARRPGCEQPRRRPRRAALLGRPFRRERRDTPKRRLRIGQPPQLVSRVRIGDGDRSQFGEVAQTRLRSGCKRLARLPPTHISPHTAPSTTIGAATSDRIAESRTAVPARPPMTETSSMRTGRPEAMTDACSPGSSSGQRLPIGNIGASSEAMTVVDRSASIRSTEIASTSIAWTTARATAANRSLGDEPSATSVATCLKAPCSPASRRSAARADASATATETSSAKPSTQASASARECSCGRAQRTPHVTPSTDDGDVSDDPNGLKPSRGQRLPFGNAESPTDASTVVRSSESSRNSHALASRTRATSDTTVSKTASRSACCVISRVTRRSAACCSCSPTTTLVGGATRPPFSTRPAADSKRAASRSARRVAAAWPASTRRLGRESRSREAPVTMTPIEAGRAHAAVGDGAGAAPETLAAASSVSRSRSVRSCWLPSS